MFVLTFARRISLSRLKSHEISKRNYCEALVSNPFYEKYADKITEIKKTSPNGFQALFERKETSYIKNPTTSCIETKGEAIKKKLNASHLSNIKSLDQVMKVDLLQDKSAENIESIWKNYHKEKSGLYSVLTNEAYKKLHTMFQEFPTFLFPLPRAQGYEFIMSQFESNSCYFTSLINYQAFKENAPVCLTITYFTELSEEKGIVLMRGELNDEELKIPEAQCLANQLQLYYSGKDHKKTNILWNFNKQPETFRHIDLICELERL